MKHKEDLLPCHILECQYSFDVPQIEAAIGICPCKYFHQEVILTTPDIFQACLLLLLRDRNGFVVLQKRELIYFSNLYTQLLISNTHL